MESEVRERGREEGRGRDVEKAEVKRKVPYESVTDDAAALDCIWTMIS